MDDFEYIKDPKKEAEDRIQSCLQDYSNDFFDISITLTTKGMDGVRALIKSGHRVRTVEEYLKDYEEEGRPTISVKDHKNQLFIEKAAKLDKLAGIVNSWGEKITELEVLEIIKEVKKITSF